MRSIIREILQIVLLALAVFFALHFMMQNFRIEGTSMEPTLHNKQYVLVNKTSYWFGHNPSRGDIIVFEAPDQPQYDRIKRVIGLPGDTVEVKNDGAVYINGQRIEEPYLSSRSGSSSGTWDVPPDEYFVMGDNRGVSYDSRSIGPIPEGNIIGKAYLIIWPPSDWSGAPNYSLALEATSP